MLSCVVEKRDRGALKKVSISSTKKGARQVSELLEESPFLIRMGDHVGDPFDDIDSGDEDLEKPPTPEIHHGGESPDAPGFSDISDNEGEEKTEGEAPTNQSEDSNDSANVNSPEEEDVNAKEESTKEKQGDSPLYDQEISPVSSTSATAEEQETTSGKGEHDVFSNEEESSSLSAQKHTETTPESESTKEHLAGSDVEDEDEVNSSRPSVSKETTEETSKGQSSGNSNDAGDPTERRRTISSGAATDDDLEMPISPLGLGLSGAESEIVDDILKSDVSKLLPDNKDESQEYSIGIIH